MNVRGDLFLKPRSLNQVPACVHCERASQRRGGLKMSLEKMHCKKLLRHLSTALDELSLATESEIAEKVHNLRERMDEVLCVAITRKAQIPVFVFRDHLVDTRVMNLIPEEVCLQHALIPLTVDDTTITLAMADPFYQAAIDDVKKRTGLQVRVVVASRSEILEALGCAYC